MIMKTEKFIGHERESSLRASGRRGLSLTEIVVGIALFVLAAIPSFGYLMSSVKQTSATDMENTAGVIASSILDRILENVDYDAVDSTIKLDQITSKELLTNGSFSANFR